ncbi:uncharacterized protein LOC131840746 [Achroia grisella]|uniref:uncharacterized protein LOC131840746 n=1 Tax=Achroia grisella TaxID=688607 RepID=UPI0027D32A8E|nr:uncharacterized protein LOC131840746 [Achroia grisella]
MEGGFSKRLRCRVTIFPANPIYRAQWISIVSKERREILFKPRKNSVLCSIHFDKIDIVGKAQRRRLRRTAVPKFQIANAKSDTESMSYDQDVVEDSVAQQIDGSTKIKRKRSYPVSVIVIMSTFFF